MRKFIIKNRQKRIYRRKVKQANSVVVHKTRHSILPQIIVALILIMGTFLMIQSFRSVNVSLTFPSISLHNPLHPSFIQNTCTIITALIKQEMAFYDPMPVFETLRYVTPIVLIDLISFFNILGNAITAGGQMIMAFISTIFMILMHFLQSILALLSNGIITIWTAIASFFTLIAHTISSFIFMLVHQIVLFVTTITTFLTTTTLHIIAIISMPFKKLYSSWLTIEPYVRKLYLHMHNTLHDLNNCVADLGRLGRIFNEGL